MTILVFPHAPWRDFSYRELLRPLGEQHSLHYVTDGEKEKERFPGSSANSSAMTARSSVSAASGGTLFLSAPLSAGPFVSEQNGRLVVPPNQALTVTVSAALSVLGVLSATASVMWWEG